jgi:hypothetical protein
MGGKHNSPHLNIKEKYNMRNAGVGIWIPSDEIVGWRVQFRAADKSILVDNEGYERTYTNEDQVPYIIDGSWKLDTMGLVADATLNCTRHPFFNPFSFAARFEILRLTSTNERAYEEIWEGMFMEVSHSGNEGGGGLYSLKFKNLRTKYEKKYWQVPEATKRGYWDDYREDTTRTGDGPNFAMPRTDGSISVNQGYTFLSSNLSAPVLLPSIGVPLGIDLTTGSSRTNMMIKGDDLLNKVLEADPDASWGVDANRRAIAGSPKFAFPVTIPTNKCKDLSAGSYEIPPYVTESRSDPGDGWQKYTYARSMPNDFTPEVSQDGPRPQIISVYTQDGMPYQVTGVDFTHTTTLSESFTTPSHVITKGTALYIVCDPQSWYKNSALVSTNTSTYEPETAIFTVSLTINRLPVYKIIASAPTQYYELVTESRMWVSTSPTFDPTAVGPFDFSDPLTITNLSAIHPDQSSQTIEFFQAKRQRFSVFDVGVEKTPTVDFVIDPSYFTQTSGKDFAIAGWGDSFYIHMAFSCHIEGDLGPLCISYYGDDLTYGTSGIGAGLDKADLTLYFSAQFGQKISLEPDFLADVQGLRYPFFSGPSFDGWVDGILVPPAYISGTFWPTSDKLGPREYVAINQYCAGVDTVWSAAETKSAFKTGIPPYKNSKPIAYERTRRF